MAIDAMRDAQLEIAWENKGELVRSLGDDYMFLYRNEQQVYSLWMEGHCVTFDSEIDALLFYIEELETEIEFSDTEFQVGAERMLGGPLSFGMPPFTQAQWAQSLLAHYEALDEYWRRMASRWGYEPEQPSAHMKAQRAYLRAIIAKGTKK